MECIKGIILFVLIDSFLEKINYRGNYYFNHFLCNLFVTLFTAKDVLRSYTDFAHCEKYTCNSNVVSLIYGLHLYHSLYYFQKLGFDDITHHVSALCVCVPLALYYSPGSLLGYSFFFTTGLPGMVNYLLLWLQRNELYDRKKQKSWNQFLNVWIRNPGCISCATLIVLKACLTETKEYFYASIIVALITVWNGSYFMEQVVADYAKRYLTCQMLA